MTAPGIPVTWFRDVTDHTTRGRDKRATLAWDTLAAVLTEHDRRTDKRGPGWTPATFADAPCTCGRKRDGRVICPGERGHRTDENVIEVHALTLDIDKTSPDEDGKRHQLDAARAELALARLRDLGLRHIVHSTHSHAPPAVACYRVVVALSRSVPAADFGRFWSAALAYLDIPHDPASKNAARFWYLPSSTPDATPVAAVHDGASLDVDMVMAIARAAVATSTKRAPRSAPAPHAPRVGDFDGLEFMATAYPGVHADDFGGGSTVWDVECPWESEHSSKGGDRDTIVTRYADGKMGFKCLHAHCEGRTWKDFRRFHQPDWVPFDERPQQPRRAWRSDRTPPPDATAGAAANEPALPPPENSTGDPFADIPHPADAVTTPPAVPTERYRRTEIGNAERMVDANVGRLRYVHAWKTWLCWNGKHWERDGTGAEMEAAKQIVEALFAEAARLGEEAKRQQSAAALAESAREWAYASSKQRAVSAMVTLAKSDPRIVATPGDFDADIWTINVQNGTLDLRTGELRRHRQSDMNTRIADVDYDPEAPCEQWERFLSRILPDRDLRDWIQRFMGYCLTGSIAEQCLMFALGDGGNGKNVLLDTMKMILGDYATVAAPDLLVLKHNEEHPTRFMDLQGRRLVAVSEIDHGRQWAEATIKRLTGDQWIKARGTFKDFCEFRNVSRFCILANSRPEVRGTDGGIWRRLKLVPFDVVIPKSDRDPTLIDKLVSTERDGIFAWAVRGCLDWHRSGLGTAAAIEAATTQYRRDQDAIGEWISERCVCVCDPGVRDTDDAGCCSTCGASIDLAPVTDRDPRETSEAIYADYEGWHKTRGGRPWTWMSVRAELLKRKWLTPYRNGAARGIRGIRLRNRGFAHNARTGTDR